MTTTQTISRDELEILAFNGETHTERALARMLLAALDSEPVAWSVGGIATHDKTWAERRSEEDNLLMEPLYRHPIITGIDENHYDPGLEPGLYVAEIMTKGGAAIINGYYTASPVAIVSEPSGYLYRTNTLTVYTPWRYVEKLPDYVKGESFEIRPQFEATPPAPVAVPDERYQHLSELYHAQEKRLFKLAQRLKGPSFDKYAYSPSQAIDVLESAIFGEKEEDGSSCRATMLQGAEPVTAANTFPCWIKCSERTPENSDEVLCAVEFDGPRDWRKKVGYWLAGKWVVYGASWKPTHWMPLPAAPEQEV